MFRFINTEKLQNQESLIISILILLMSGLSHISTFIQFSNYSGKSLFIPIIFWLVFIFFSVSSFSLYFDLDIAFIQKIKLIIFLILGIFTDLVFYEIFLSVIILSINFYININYKVPDTKISKIITFVIDFFVMILLFIYFRKNLILLFLFAAVNIFYHYLPLLCKKMIPLIKTNVPYNLRDYYIFEYAKQIVPFTSWLIPFLIPFFLLNCCFCSLFIFVSSSLLCLIVDIYDNYINYSKELLFYELLQILVKLSLMFGLYYVYLMG